MNDEIDWSQAPEGATHYAPSRPHPWHKVIGEQAWYWLNNKQHWTPYLKSTAAEKIIPEGIPRPVEPVGNPDWPTDERIDMIEPDGNEGERYAETVNWSEAPADATRYCPVRGLWYRPSSEGLPGYMEFFNTKYGRPRWTVSALSSADLDSMIQRPTPATRAAQPLLPENWLSLEPSDRKAALFNKASVLMRSPGSEKYRRMFASFLLYTGLKKLADISDDVFEVSRAHVFVCLLPMFVKEGAVEWDNLNRITCEEMAKREDVIPEAAPERVPVGPRPDEDAQTNFFPPPHNLPGGQKDPRPPFPCEGYERLHDVYRDAHNQAAYEKGAQRHANDLPFHEQRMQTISQGLNSPDGMAYQVIKKLQEGLQMASIGARRRELLGALNYLAGIVIFLDDREAGGGE